MHMQPCGESGDGMTGGLDFEQKKKKKKGEVGTLRTGSKSFCNGAALPVMCVSPRSFVNAVLVVRARLDAGALSTRSVHKRDHAEKALPVPMS